MRNSALLRLRKRSLLGIPGYAILPFAIDFAANSIAFWGSRVINLHHAPHMISSSLISHVPVNGWWVIMYYLSFVVWAVSYVWVARRSEEDCYRLLGGDLLCKAACLLIFVIYPTSNIRPDVSGPGVGNALLRLLYWTDAPDNLFPSMHCYMSWYACRWLCRKKDLPKGGMALSWILCGMIFYSTLATRQHYPIDVAGGVLLAEAALYLEPRLRPGRLYWNLDRRLFG